MSERTEANVHAGHRMRVLKNFLQAGFVSRQPHEVLEQLLWHVNRRCDTNLLGHRLLDAFGSLEGVLRADPDALEKVNGIGKKSAESLAAILPEVGAYLLESLRGAEVNNYLLYFLADWFLREKDGVCGILFADAEGRLLDFLPSDASEEAWNAAPAHEESTLTLVFYGSESVSDALNKAIRERGYSIRDCCRVEAHRSVTMKNITERETER